MRGYVLEDRVKVKGNGESKTGFRLGRKAIRSVPEERKGSRGAAMEPAEAGSQSRVREAVVESEQSWVEGKKLLRCL